jgi:hypothetical protein
MLKISNYSNQMMKTSFDIPNPPLKKPKKYIITQDNLFFALYSKNNNLSNFDMADYNEINEKIKIAEQLEKMKFKNKEDIINNLVYDKTIKLDTFNVLCIFYKINILFINERTYVKMKYKEDNNEFLYINDKGQYLEVYPDIEKLLEVNIEKPLRSLSFYKLGELQEMATKLVIDIEKKKKQELYDSIKMVLSRLYKIE